ncbi:hypothetical protein BH23ACT2_BH23ACT2_29400 [soil metagenome]
MHVGELVEVYTAFDGTWAPGFEIAEMDEGGYRVRRLCDGALIPHTTSPDDLRAVSRAH